MGEYNVKPITNLMKIECTPLLEESKKDGFRFLERLMNDYNNGTNTFNKPGEILYGVFTTNGGLTVIAGLNIDPYSGKQKIGRVRRFYVSKEYRRNGIGKMLLEKIMSFAKDFYAILVLHTDTKQADDFYTSLGFLKESIFPNTTHYKKLS
jgi:GNAT superfamily N-acetyltransferase